MKLYGANEEFIELAKEYEDLFLARVLSSSRGIHRVATEFDEFNARVSGKKRHDAKNTLELPAVGDFVMVDRKTGDRGEGVIVEILPRKSIFVRKAASPVLKPQVVAANIDIVFICMSLNQNYNIRRLERYLSLAWESGATPVVVLTKKDLCDNYEEKYQEVAEVAFGADIIGVSSEEEDGYEEVLSYVKEGTTIALIGSSGVGKSTMINHLLGKSLQDTKSIGNDDKGRHTTTRRELMTLPAGAFMIDTPGMRELGMWEAASGVEKTFAEVEDFVGMCRFSDCTHTTEPGCAVRKAVEEGQLSEERVASYLKLKKEDSFISDKISYMAKKGEKFKKIAEINKARKKDNGK